jgi:hypothetical protein
LTAPSRRKQGDTTEGSGTGGPPKRKMLAGCWWHHKRDPKGTGSAIAGDVFTTVQAIRGTQTTQREEQKHHLALYTNMNVSGQGQTASASGKRMRYNLVKSAVDTAVSLVAQQRPRPMFITTDGMWGQQKQARLLTQVLEGQLHELGMYEIGPDLCRDGCTVSTGHVFGYLDPETGEPRLERVLPLELFVDHNDGMRRSPRTIYRRRLISRDVLCALYPKKAKVIAAAEGPSAYDRSDFFLEYQTTVDQVVVIEAWHLRSGKSSEDGRHVIALSSGVLCDEEYEGDRLPFAAYRWSNRPVGYEGEGIAEQCRDAQWRINRLISKSERLSDLGSNAMLTVHGDSKIRVETLTNEPMKIIRHYGQAPVLTVNDAVPQSLQMEIEQIKAEKFQELGFSQMRTQGEKPAGLDSGKALREYEDISSSRHVVNGRAYEASFMEVCKLLLMLNIMAADRATEKPDGDDDSGPAASSYKVTARRTRGGTPLVSKVKWSEVYDPKNELVMSMWPTSILPSTPAGLRQAVQEYVDGGWVSRPFAQALMQLPDLDAAMRLELADLDAVMDDVEQILDGGQVEPDGYANMAMAADVARRSYLRAKSLRASPDVLLNLQHYIEVAMDNGAAPPPADPNGLTGMSGAGGVAGIDPNMMGQQPAMMPPGAPPGMSPGMPPPGV